MPTVVEALADQETPLGTALGAGLENISYNQTLTFTKYVKYVSPIDGFVFWVNASILKPGANLNGFLGNEVTPDQVQKIASAAPTIIAKGSVHYATSLAQGEEETYSTNRVTFTSEQEIEDLNAVAASILYIASFDGIRFAFSSRAEFYTQADLWHYGGSAVYADMSTQVVDNVSQIRSSLPIVSNSLPIWLSFNGYSKYDFEFFAPPSFPLYASFLLPANVEPPFASVHIDPSSTRGIAAAPTFDPDTQSQEQLCKENVRVTLWGLNNAAAQEFLAFVLQYSMNNPGVIGLMNTPIVRDDKRGQVELQAIAQKKVIDFEVNYLQSQVRNVANQLFETVIVTYLAET